MYRSSFTPLSIAFTMLLSVCLTLENEGDMFLRRGQRAVSGLRGILRNVGKVLAKPEEFLYSCQVQSMHVLVIAPGKSVFHG